MQIFDECKGKATVWSFMSLGVAPPMPEQADKRNLILHLSDPVSGIQTVDPPVEVNFQLPERGFGQTGATVTTIITKYRNTGTPECYVTCPEYNGWIKLSRLEREQGNDGLRVANWKDNLGPKTRLAIAAAVVAAAAVAIMNTQDGQPPETSVAASK